LTFSAPTRNSEAFMSALLPEARAAVCAREEVPPRLIQVPQRLLLQIYRTGREPGLSGACLSELPALL
jgi:hypothetical protein